VSVKINWREALGGVTLCLKRTYRIRRTPMDSKITQEQLKEMLAEDIERLLEAAVEAVNQAQPGHIIDDSEEPVRDAAGQFRHKLFEKALELRSQREAFSPSGRPRRSSPALEEQGNTNDSCDHR
jgi:hypothetical protein